MTAPPSPPPSLQYSSPIRERPAPHAPMFLVFGILGIVFGMIRAVLGGFMTLVLSEAARSGEDVPLDYLAFVLASLVLSLVLLVGSVASLRRSPFARKTLLIGAIFDTLLPAMLAVGSLAHLSTGYADASRLTWIIIAARFAQGLIWWIAYGGERAREHFVSVTTPAQP